MAYREWTQKLYWAMQRKIAPSLKYSQFLYEDMLSELVTEETSWLDVGCGHQVLPPWREEEELKLVRRSRMIVGIDYDTGALRNHRNISAVMKAGVERLPFHDNTFNLVTANMVVEHLDDPARQFSEIQRILKPGGVFLFHTPNRYGYYALASSLLPDSWKRKLVYFLQRRNEEDVFPTHYRANTRKEISAVARLAGLTPKKIRMIVSSPQFAIIPPLVLLELLWVRLLMMDAFKSLRPNIIAVLEKAGVDVG